MWGGGIGDGRRIIAEGWGGARLCKFGAITGAERMENQEIWGCASLNAVREKRLCFLGGVEEGTLRIIGGEGGEFPN